MTLESEQVKNDMILIDFAGDYNSATRKGTQLGRLLKAASPHETHLVLPSNLKTTDSIAIAKGYESMNFDHVVISKIDGTSSMGSLLEVLHKINKPISYFSTGPVIPDDIEPASPVKLANLILSR